MRIATLLIVLMGSAVLAGGQASGERVPVVVELFTSEGCSSCPPADALLSKLAKDQAVPGVQVIPLGMHVTYWDQQGWKDPASLALATDRQQSYSRVWGVDRVYTPQAVIDGHDELVGSDEDGVRHILAKAGRQPHARVTLTTSLDGNSLKAQATVENLPPESKEKLESWMVITEDGLSSVVKRGENGGRTLHHDAAVRAIFGGDVAAAKVLAFSAPLRPEWRRDHLHAVVLLQGKSTHRIWGAATAALK
jgi:hypothetical protein